MTIPIKANRAYPSLPAPGSSLEAHTRLLEALKEAVEIHERRIPNAYLDSFVRLRELVELGLLEVRGGQITSAVEAGGGGGDNGGGGGAVVSTQLRGATWTRGGETLTTPANDVLLYFPQAAKIHGITLMGQTAAGSCELDIFKTPIGSLSGGVGSSICGSNKPTITSGVQSVDTTLAGWTVDIDAGDVLTLRLVSVSVFKHLFVQLHIRES